MIAFHIVKEHAWKAIPATLIATVKLVSCEAPGAGGAGPWSREHAIETARAEITRSL